jgi:hypothetical protein
MTTSYVSEKWERNVPNSTTKDWEIFEMPRHWKISETYLGTIMN